MAGTISGNLNTTSSTAGYISGLVSGMDTSSIVSQLMAIEKQPLTNLQQQQSDLKTKLAAWQEANTRVLALKVKSYVLANPITFQNMTLSSSDEGVATGTASSGAAQGTYVITVGSLARAGQLKSAGYADTDKATVGTGTISVSIGGSSLSTSINIDSTNNTLNGVAAAINQANAGVTASIVNDGTSGSPYRLLVTSNSTGTAGEAHVTTSLTGGTDPAFSTLEAAKDATVTLGEGDGALAFTKSSNTITDIIPGVTLNLKSADPSSPVTVSVGSDTSNLTKNIQDFVDQYNGLIGFVDGQFAYDPTGGNTPTLFADPSLEAIQHDLVNAVTNPVSGLTQSVKLLSQIGITMNSDNTLTVDQSKLTDALNNKLSSVKNLFATVGTASNGNVSYVSSSDKTVTTSGAGYAVNITAAATQARVTAGAAQTAALTGNETLVINGTNISLAAQMDQAAVIAKINESTGATGIVASATGADGTGTGNYLTLTRVQYGSSPTISVSSNVSNGGSTPAADTSGIGRQAITETDYVGESGSGTGAKGVDVSGTINGEAATGSGQMLKGNSGNASTDGLQIRVAGQSTGDYGTVAFTKGISGALSDYLDFVTRTGTGSVMVVQDSLQTQISRFDTEMSALQARLDSRQAQLSNQFAQMEAQLSTLKNQGDYLTSQFAQMSANAAASTK